MEIAMKHKDNHGYRFESFDLVSINIMQKINQHQPMLLVSFLDIAIKKAIGTLRGFGM